jgi:HSP20 family protein
MAEAATKLPIKTETEQGTLPAKAADWQPFDILRGQVDRLFHDFQAGFLQAPFFRPFPDIESFWRRELGFSVTPAMDIVEKEGHSKSRPNCPDSTPRISTFSSPTAC